MAVKAEGYKSAQRSLGTTAKQRNKAERTGKKRQAKKYRTEEKEVKLQRNKTNWHRNPRTEAPGKVLGIATSELADDF